MTTGHSGTIRQMNSQIVSRHLRKLREATIFKLSMSTELSVVTVNAILAQMLETGEAREVQMIPSKGGRPSRLFAYNADYRHALVVFGCQKNDTNLIHVRVVNLFRECVYKDEMYIGDVETASFAQLIDKAIAKFPTIGVIAFGLPGVEENGVIICNDYCRIEGNVFMDYYRKRYGVPVIFMNDVNAAAYGFHRSQAKDDAQPLAAVYFPRIYRPGAGFVINGCIHKGAHHYAGEIGRLPFGVDWLSIDYTDNHAVADAVSRLLDLLCCVIAPRQFVLYGDFFAPDCAQMIKQMVFQRFGRRYELTITVCDLFERDFEQGMFDTALEALDSYSMPVSV